MKKNDKQKKGSKDNNRKKKVRAVTPKRGGKSVKETKGTKSKGNSNPTKKELVAENFRLLEKFANETRKGNQGVGKKPKKRALQTSNKPYSEKRRVKQLEAEVKSLKGKLKKAVKGKPKKAVKPKGKPKPKPKKAVKLNPKIKPEFITDDRSILQIEFQADSYKDKITSLDFLYEKTFNIYRLRDKLLPRAFMVIIETSHNGKTVQRASKISEPHIAVTLENVKRLAKEFLQEFKTSYFEYLKDHAPEDFDEESENDITGSSWVFDPDNVTSVYIRFIYAPTE